MNAKYQLCHVDATNGKSGCFFNGSRSAPSRNWSGLLILLQELSVEIADHLLCDSLENGSAVRVDGTSLVRRYRYCVGNIAHGNDKENVSHPPRNHIPWMSLCIGAPALHGLISKRLELRAPLGANVLVSFGDKDTQHLSAVRLRHKLAETLLSVLFHMKMKRNWSAEHCLCASGGKPWASHRLLCCRHRRGDNEKAYGNHGQTHAYTFDFAGMS